MIAIVLALAFIALLFVIVIVGQPDQFTVSRSTKISASPEKVFSQVNELQQWEAWSPWAKLDPNAKVTFEGPASGVGSAMAWSGNHKVGVGKMTITESKPGEIVGLRLDFEKPMKATNTAEFSFKPEGGQTVVVWSMTGKNSFAGKLFGLLMNCEKMCGCMFEKGLASLKTVAEAR